MKRKILYSLGTLVVGALTIAAVANGPYYALPAWAQKLVCTTTSNCPRFIVLADWNSEAVLDRETGLVWERSPSTSPLLWLNAQRHCNRSNTGDRLGWRLPTLQELASLVDRTQPNPALPSGHPFQKENVQSSEFSFYWSATTLAGTGNEPLAWGVSFGIGFVDNVVNALKSDQAFVWCVRGGQGVDPQ